jgi:gamma-glutamylcyclotransferase (GGCT)/AIG2-like uncharacterized protein YtfP
MPSASVRLFVYGSLKRGGRHHEQLAGARFLGLAETEPGYRLEPLGEYLALVRVAGPSPVDGSVAGELFEVDESRLVALDTFEGDAYIRGQVMLSRARRPRDPPRDEADDEAEDVFALAYLKKAR